MYLLQLCNTNGFKNKNFTLRWTYCKTCRQTCCIFICLEPFNTCQTVHTHLQQPNVAWGQSLESAKHVLRWWSSCWIRSEFDNRWQFAVCLFLESQEGKPADRGPVPLCAWTLQPVLGYLMQDNLLSPYNNSFLSLHNRQVCRWCV